MASNKMVDLKKEKFFKFAQFLNDAFKTSEKLIRCSITDNVLSVFLVCVSSVQNGSISNVYLESIGNILSLKTLLMGLVKFIVHC